jgi:hypothetical protein
MARALYRYVFPPELAIAEVESTLVLALLAVESLHGAAQMQLDAGHYLDTDNRVCVVDASGPVGRDLNRVFVGFLMGEFGEGSFTVESVPQEVPA